MTKVATLLGQGPGRMCRRESPVGCPSSGQQRNFRTLAPPCTAGNTVPFLLLLRKSWRYKAMGLTLLQPGAKSVHKDIPPPFL
jgi:hypothetical protein